MDTTILQAKMAEFRKAKKPHTWRTVCEFVHEMHFDDDEYFHMFPSHRDDIDKPIWDEKVRWIPVFWVVGGSEGYYVHVETQRQEQDKDYKTSELMILGKFWNWERAEEATSAVSRFVNLF